MKDIVKNGLTPAVEARIREIVREEVAAHKEQPEIIGLTVEQKKVIVQFFELMKLRPTI